MKATRPVGFMKPRVGLIFFLSYHKSCYNKYTVNPTRKLDKDHKNKEDKSKYLIDEAHEKFIEHHCIYCIYLIEHYHIVYASLEMRKIFFWIIS